MEQVLLRVGKKLVSVLPRLAVPPSPSPPPYSFTTRYPPRSPPAMSAVPVERRARYKKKEGVLTIDATHLHWTPDREGVGRPLRLPLASIKSQHVAKNAAALLRLIAAEHPKGLVFEFGSPPTPAWTDRDAAGTRGVPTALVSLEPAEQMGNTVRYVLNPAKIHQIFVEQPDVHRAYLATVPPGKLAEQAFWNKYFASRVFSRGAAAAAAAAVGAGSRARAAAAGATAAATEADELFAQYEAGEAGALAAEAARRVGAVAAGLNLERADPPGVAAAAAARSSIRAAGLPPPVLPPSLVGGGDDAGGAGGGKAGGGGGGARRGMGATSASGGAAGGGSLPLMRRVNRHGALVNDSLTAAAAWAESADDRERPLADLAPLPPPALTPLTIHNHSAFRGVGVGGGGADGGGAAGSGGAAGGDGVHAAAADGNAADEPAATVATDPGWATWSADLSYLLEPSAAAGRTLQRLSAEIAARRS
ncbi:hypothetical protein I4F81_007508 [Pyropia yezoensis]|uniref:Uncharacterized protein n=1 Tax=Pyropia yezoensis TaxID=2788 RepID=A0ACC3C589_PYRYE|nr:hypothetical protein I4F81_007508 [Neopyropia yezoensis]